MLNIVCRHVEQKYLHVVVGHVWVCRHMLTDRAKPIICRQCHHLLPYGQTRRLREPVAVQDPEMAALKDSTVYPTLDTAQASRSRDSYMRLADSPPTL